jgi:hypothetical protein
MTADILCGLFYCEPFRVLIDWLNSHVGSPNELWVSLQEAGVTRSIGAEHKKAVVPQLKGYDRFYEVLFVIDIGYRFRCLQ